MAGGSKHRSPVDVARANLDRHRQMVKHWRNRLALETKRAATKEGAAARASAEVRP
jgi:hypothetical protein